MRGLEVKFQRAADLASRFGLEDLWCSTKTTDNHAQVESGGTTACTCFAWAWLLGPFVLRFLFGHQEWIAAGAAYGPSTNIRQISSEFARVRPFEKKKTSSEF